ncbi:glycosyltransferase [Microbacterium sp. C7(2022)]|uniref:glycosyltransferase n=1 Tax=Microbacterium sp. C7(2022) TaxID=2992759 RepID=UPI00237A263E|nr:glycosyltransferase [Microbacterium sp. C7(2022)]MDE0547328.1 glycosyltransferase [Microbacterium sp. C7(2022)]
MVATLRVMLDQVVSPIDADLAEASSELARALIRRAPEHCVVEGIAPAGGGDLDAIAGLGGVRRTALARRELAAALQLGVGTGIGGGMIHSPSLFAPLVKHDRVHDNDQTVVTVWDLGPWESPDEYSRSTVSWHRAMLKRAVKHADAVVVPTHALAARLGDIAAFGRRIRVISGASPQGFRVPSDEIGRRRELGLPEGFVLLAGGPMPSHALETGFGAIAASGVDLPVVVIGCEEGLEPAVADLASSAGVPEHRLHVRGALEAHDRAAVYGAALAFVAPSRRAAFPWRVVDALTLGVPVVAASSAGHAEVIADGGAVVEGQDATTLRDGLGDALSAVLESTQSADRAAVLAADRGRAFSWNEAAERVWQLHADL